VSGAPPQRSHAEDRVRLVKRLILACGLAGAAVIWLVNAPPPDAGVDLESSKAYLREMEVVGGTANVPEALPSGATETRRGSARRGGNASSLTTRSSTARAAWGRP